MTSTPAALSQLPLFPLQSVLFPDGSLALRVFEVRYLDMIGRCHKLGEPFGVVCLTRGSEVRRREMSAKAAGVAGDAFAEEAFYEVGTLAHITDLERPQPGLMMLRAVGGRRFTITTCEQLRHGLWIADAEALAEDSVVAVPPDLEFARRGLQFLLDNIRHHNAEVPVQEPYRWDDCGWLANRWCELLPLASAIKQRFMTLDSPLLRLELVVDALHQIGFKLPGEPGASAG